jgi:hypothetical protein
MIPKMIIKANASILPTLKIEIILDEMLTL